MRREVVGPEPHGGLVLRDRLVPPARGWGERGGQVEVRVGEIRPQAHGRPELLDRLGHVAGNPREGRAQVVVGFREVRHDAHGRPELLDRLLRVAGRPLKLDALLVVGFGDGRQDAQGLAELGRCLGLRRPGEGGEEIRVRDPVVGRHRHGVPEEPGAIPPIAQLEGSQRGQAGQDSACCEAQCGAPVRARAGVRSSAAHAAMTKTPISGT